MTSSTFNKKHQSAASPVLPGHWRLGAGRAMTLQPRQAGVLRIEHGRVWATFDGPHHGPLNDLGDRIVGIGGQLRLQAGQRLVIEAWNAQTPAYFSWEPLPLPGCVQQTSRRWASVAQPLADLRLALALGMGAAGRLAIGLAGLAGDFVTRRGRESLAM